MWSAGWWGQVLGVAAHRFARPKNLSGFEGQQRGERPGELLACKGGWVLLALVKAATVRAASPWQSCFSGGVEDFCERMESSALQTELPPSIQRGTRQLLPGPAQHPAGSSSAYAYCTSEAASACFSSSSNGSRDHPNQFLQLLPCSYRTRAMSSPDSLFFFQEAREMQGRD